MNTENRRNLITSSTALMVGQYSQNFYHWLNLYNFYLIPFISPTHTLAKGFNMVIWYFSSFKYHTMYTYMEPRLTLWQITICVHIFSLLDLITCWGSHLHLILFRCKVMVAYVLTLDM